MIFVLVILYFITHYLTPDLLLGSFAYLHIEMILAVLVIIGSIPAFTKSSLLKNPQSLAIAGLTFAFFMSVLIGAHWAGGAAHAIMQFVPNGIAYFLVVLHCNSKRRLKVLVLTLSLICIFIIGNGVSDLVRGIPQSALTPGTGLGDPLEIGTTASPYLMRLKSDTGEWIYRLQGLGEINDPNDLGQFIVCIIPLLFIFWRAKRAISNFLFVIIPLCILLTGLFLTHSRGALIALTALVIFESRRRIGTVPAVVVAGVFLFGAMALQFTGGRDISASAGEDRTDLWGQGIGLVKTHPLFGVGFNSLPEYTENHLTAHNSIVVCAAELGLFGLYFWSMYLLTTIRDALAVAALGRRNDGEHAVVVIRPPENVAVGVDEGDELEIRRLGRLILLSLIGFLMAGWFLSRAFAMTLFVLGGIAGVIYEMALQRGMVAPRMKLARVFALSGVLAVTLIIVMYVVIRILNAVR